MVTDLIKVLQLCKIIHILYVIYMLTIAAWYPFKVWYRFFAGTVHYFRIWVINFFCRKNYDVYLFISTVFGDTTYYKPNSGPLVSRKGNNFRCVIFAKYGCWTAHRETYLFVVAGTACMYCNLKVSNITVLTSILHL